MPMALVDIVAPLPIFVSAPLELFMEIASTTSAARSSPWSAQQLRKRTVPHRRPYMTEASGHCMNVRYEGTDRTHHVWVWIVGVYTRICTFSVVVLVRLSRSNPSHMQDPTWQTARYTSCSDLLQPLGSWFCSVKNFNIPAITQRYFRSKLCV